MFPSSCIPRINARVSGPITDGLVLWLDASQVVGLNDGDAVATWSDMSGQGNHATNGTPAARPTFKTGIINGHPVMRFDGVDDGMMLSQPITAHPCTVFAVLARGAPGSNVIIIANDTHYFPYALLEYSGGTYSATGAGGGGRFWGNNSHHLADGFSVVTSVTTEEIWVNGSAIEINDSGQDPAAFHSFNQVGMRTGGAAFYHDGDIAEVLVYTNTVSTATRLHNEAYLKSKYALP